MKDFQFRLRVCCSKDVRGHNECGKGAHFSQQILRVPECQRILMRLHGLGMREE